MAVACSGDLTPSGPQRRFYRIPMSSTLPDDRDRYERARRRVREIRAFYLHVAVFVAVNILLHVINFVAAPKVYWAFWPLFGLGRQSPRARARDLSLDAVRWQGVGATQDPGAHEP
jgi:hypothetical protein